MKGLVRISVMVLTSITLLVAAPANIDGPWQFTVELSMGTSRPVVTFKQNGEKITGTYVGRYGTSNLEGLVKENQVEFTVTMVVEGTTISGVFAGTYEADKMRGQVEYEAAGEGAWTAVRISAKK